MAAQEHPKTIAQNLGLKISQVQATIGLLEEGATIPFISRYRKEATGSLDEVSVTSIRDQLENLMATDKRRDAMIESLKQRDILTEELHNKLLSAIELTNLEDIYLPYRPKRRTRSTIAQEKGLKPLAKALFTQNDSTVQPEKYINPEKDVHTASDALDGARDIVAEWISESQPMRARLRDLFQKRSFITSKVVEKNREQGVKFSDYFDYSEHVEKAPSHRLLAMFRGENEKILKLSVRPEEQGPLNILEKYFVKKSAFSRQMVLAVQDSYKRLLLPSLENELRNTLKKGADSEAIAVFADNMRELLLAPPLGQKNIMALDPGYRTGAKLVCLDSQGTLLHFDTIFPTQGQVKQKEAAQVVNKLLQEYKIEAIAIGNGTASRETESFIRELTANHDVIVTLVNEDGASIYSASELARKEFPDHDITVRGAVSIGRRLQDPLAELVKIDPKAVGVGQYQHDVDQTALKNSLVDVVTSCVNSVGVELNTASVELLTYVSGLGPTLAENIVAYRNDNGPFSSRKELLKVPRLGAKAFEQCAGFLRIHNGTNPLDNTAVHPERYSTVNEMAKNLNVTVSQLIRQEAMQKQIRLNDYVSDTIGLPTLQDIMEELAKPGRDPRETFTQFSFAENVHTIDDLIAEMRLPGIVTNVTKFGAFVDIGVHQDGLIHISQLADRFVKDPAEIVKINQQLTVRVLEIDKKRKRISLSLRDI